MMNDRGAVALTLLAVSIVAAVALLVQRRPSGQRVAADAPTSTHTNAPSTPQPPTVQRLTPQQLAGQRVIYAYAGLRPPASLLEAIRVGEAAGVIFFSNNISSPSQLGRVINQLQAASLASPVRRPLLMLTDQEGGEVRRLPGAPTLSEKQIGTTANPVAAARAAGSGAAQNLRAAAINVNLAPVLDVYRQTGNFIDQFQRSYSNNPTTVAQLGAAFITAQQRLAVAATAKHFPGLGSAAQSQNTDLRPVRLNSSLSTLRSVDEAPYRSAIAAGVKLVMVSWAIFPALDPHWPAGLSSSVIEGELRHRLGFHGVTITDGIDAGAVTPFGTLSRRSVLAASAGADLILCAATNPSNNTPTIGLTALQSLTSAITHHTISRSAAEQSAGRILVLRAAP